jgi:hypothetical protein
MTIYLYNLFTKTDTKTICWIDNKDATNQNKTRIFAIEEQEYKINKNR